MSKARLLGPPLVCLIKMKESGSVPFPSTQQANLQAFIEHYLLINLHPVSPQQKFYQQRQTPSLGLIDFNSAALKINYNQQRNKFNNGYFKLHKQMIE